MNYSFDPFEAEKYGTHEAIILANLKFWLFKNKTNDKHFYEGRYWTYNSIEAFKKQFFFWTTNQIRTALDSLIKQKVIMTGNYNSNKYDRTLWYALVDDNLHLLNSTNAICEKSQMDSGKITNDLTDNKPDNKLKNYNKKISKTDIEDIFQHWTVVMNKPKAKLDAKRRRRIQMALELGYSVEELKEAIQNCTYSKFHMGDNPSAMRYNDIELILRDAQHIDRFLTGIKAPWDLSDIVAY